MGVLIRWTWFATAFKQDHHLIERIAGQVLGLRTVGVLLAKENADKGWEQFQLDSMSHPTGEPTVRQPGPQLSPARLEGTGIRVRDLRNHLAKPAQMWSLFSADSQLVPELQTCILDPLTPELIGSCAVNGLLVRWGSHDLFSPLGPGNPRYFARAQVSVAIELQGEPGDFRQVLKATEACNVVNRTQVEVDKCLGTKTHWCLIVT